MNSNFRSDGTRGRKREFSPPGRSRRERFLENNEMLRKPVKLPDSQQNADSDSCNYFESAKSKVSHQRIAQRRTPISERQQIALLCKLSASDQSPTADCIGKSTELDMSKCELQSSCSQDSAKLLVRVPLSFLSKKFPVENKIEVVQHCSASQDLLSMKGHHAKKFQPILPKNPALQKSPEHEKMGLVQYNSVQEFKPSKLMVLCDAASAARKVLEENEAKDMQKESKIYKVPSKIEKKK